MPIVQRWNQPLVITPEIRALLNEPTLLIVTKAAVRSRVHRHVYMDYVGVKRFDADGKLVGEFRIIGLFTSTAYTRSTRTIPYLRRKVDAVVRRAGFDPDGHSGKALVNVLENYPRDELFQLDDDTLYHFALAVLQLDERPRVRVLPRRDRFDRFVSILVYVPRERYDSDVRKAIGDYLADAYNGRVSAFHPFFPEGPLVRVHFIIGLSGGEGPHPDRGTLERAVEAIVRTWIDELERRARARLRSGQGARHVRAVSRRVLAGLSGDLFAGDRAGRHPRHRGIVGRPAARRRLPPPRLGGGQYRRAEGLELQPADPALRARARAGEHGLQGGGRAHLSDRSQHRRYPRRLAARHAARARRRPRHRSRRRQARPGSGLPGGDERRRGERRLQCARARGRNDVARRRADPDGFTLPAADPRALFAGLHVDDAGQACAGRVRHRAPVPGAL